MWTFVGSICVRVCPKNSWIHHCWKKSIDIFDFLNGYNHHRKVVSKANHFWLGVAKYTSGPSRLQDSLIINTSIDTFEGINWHLCLILPIISCIFYQLFHDRGRYHIETNPLICGANQWTGFYMITVSVMKELNLAGVYLVMNCLTLFIPLKATRSLQFFILVTLQLWGIWSIFTRILTQE